MLAIISRVPQLHLAPSDGSLILLSVTFSTILDFFAYFKVRFLKSNLNYGYWVLDEPKIGPVLINIVNPINIAWP